MNRSRLIGALCLVLPLVGSGCALVERAMHRTPPPAATTDPNAKPAEPAAAATTTDAAKPSSESPANPQAEELTRIMTELQTLGALDPQEQARLIQDLGQTDPALWSQVVQTFRTSLAYRRKLAEKERSAQTQLAGNAPAKASASAGAPRELPAAVVSSAPAQPAPASAQPQAAPGDDVMPPTVTLGSESAAREKPANAANIKQVSYDGPAPPFGVPATPGDWQRSLGDAIVALEKTTKDAPRSNNETVQHVWLRMLYLAAGRRDDAMKPISGLEPAEQEFWTKEVYGLATYLDSARVAEPSRRAAEAAGYLSKAAVRLAETGTLAVKSLAFCSEVHSYGVYTTFPKHEFRPDQKLLLYCEVENFKSEETAKGFHTALKASYEVLDSRGHRVVERELPLTEEHCQNHRRDYFIPYVVWTPERIYDGNYTLRLTIEDTLSKKVGQSSIEFTIKEKSK
jgi:hypothetical protein